MRKEVGIKINNEKMYKRETVIKLVLSYNNKEIHAVYTITKEDIKEVEVYHRLEKEDLKNANLLEFIKDSVNNDLIEYFDIKCKQFKLKFKKI